MKKAQVNKAISKATSGHVYVSNNKNWVQYLRQITTLRYSNPLLRIIIVVLILGVFLNLFRYKMIYYQSYTSHTHTEQIREVVEMRLKSLRENIATKSSIRCTVESPITVSSTDASNEKAFIEITHGLWFSGVKSQPFLLPPFAHLLLDPFDTKDLYSQFCIFGFSKSETSQEAIFDDTRRRINSVPLNATFNFPASDTKMLSQEWEPRQARIGDYLIGADDVYLGRPIWLKPIYKDIQSILPPFDEHLFTNELSQHSRQVAAILWANLKPEYVDALVQAISQQLGDSMAYVSVDKCNLGGQCQKLMQSKEVGSATHNHGFKLSKRWAGIKHKLCDMPLSLVDDICEKLQKPCKKIHIAWDGNGYILKHKTDTRVFIAKDQLHDDAINPNILDMMLAVHADLFIMNPLSTWSWQVALVRSLLGLPTAPELDELPAAGLLSLWMYEESNRTDINYTSVWRDYKAKYSFGSDVTPPPSGTAIANVPLQLYQYFGRVFSTNPNIRKRPMG